MKAVVGQPDATADRRLTGEQDRAKPLYVVPLSLATMNTCRTPKKEELVEYLCTLMIPKAMATRQDRNMAAHNEEVCLPCTYL